MSSENLVQMRPQSFIYGWGGVLQGILGQVKISH